MSSLALMRWLESAPQRYDAGMRWLTLGRVSRLHASLAEAAAPKPGAAVLEIGCGTGAITARLIERGASVTALDQNPEMLEQARAKLRDASGAVTWIERTASEIDALPEAGFDAAVAGFCLSEMSAAERAYVLRELAVRLRPGGVLAVADEVRPRSTWQRVLHALLRGPQAALAWLVVGTLSHPIPDLAAEVADAGFSIRRERHWLFGRYAVLIAERPL